MSADLNPPWVPVLHEFSWTRTLRPRTDWPPPRVITKTVTYDARGLTYRLERVEQFVREGRTVVHYREEER